ncbi:MAG TPA: GNAT family N-acetyltransferase [Chitinophagaceae bacterium]
MTDAESISIRTIRPEDNAAIAKIIRDALAEFGANHPGTVFDDPSTDHLYELFSATPRSVYFIAERNGIILGGAGIYPTEALPDGTCEIVKIYLSPQARGSGLGGTLIRKSLEAAKDFGYSQVYLESMPELRQALSVYEHYGFRYIPAAMGNSGHTGCDVFMIRAL